MTLVLTLVLAPFLAGLVLLWLRAELPRRMVVGIGDVGSVALVTRWTWPSCR